MVESQYWREQLLMHMEMLADRVRHYNAWVLQKHVVPGREHDEFDYLVHFLYDDTDLAADPFGYIGLVLKSEEEARVIQAVVRELDSVFDKYGTELSDEQYIGLPEWNHVIEAASKAHEVLLANGKE